MGITTTTLTARGCGSRPCTYAKDGAILSRSHDSNGRQYVSRFVCSTLLFLHLTDGTRNPSSCHYSTNTISASEIRKGSPSDYPGMIPRPVSLRSRLPHLLGHTTKGNDFALYHVEMQSYTRQTRECSCGARFSLRSMGHNAFGTWRYY